MSKIPPVHLSEFIGNYNYIAQLQEDLARQKAAQKAAAAGVEEEEKGGGKKGKKGKGGKKGFLMLSRFVLIVRGHSSTDQMSSQEIEQT